MIIQRRKGLTHQPAGLTLFEPRVRQLRRHGLQGVHDPLSCRRDVRIGLGKSIFRVSIGPPRVPSQKSP